MADFDDLMPHLILCGFTFNSNMACQLIDVILPAMKEHGIGSLILTRLEMVRNKLIALEESNEEDRIYKVDEDGNICQGSIYDDLESFQYNLLFKEKINDENVNSLFMPKLTKQELKLVDIKNSSYMETFMSKFQADIDDEEMKKSNSESKFLHGRCFRDTTVLNVSPDHFTFTTPVNTIVEMDPKKEVSKDNGKF